jgi:predicted RNase H-like HicB family nuclease
MTRTYTFVFSPEPEGGYTVTCPALPGLVTYGESMEEARNMARDAMEGLIEVMLEKAQALRKAIRPKAFRALVASLTRCRTKVTQSRSLSS